MHRALLLLTALIGPLAAHPGITPTMEQLTSVFENSTPHLRYDYCENIHDRRGYTLGFAGFTTGTYDGTMLVEDYTRRRPGNALAGYLPALRAIDAGPHDADGRNPDLRGLSGFPAAVRASAGDPAFRVAQHALVDRLYGEPALRTAARLGARLPITIGQFYDTAINLGADGLADLVRRTTRAIGGKPRTVDETRWLAQFLALRLGDLESGDAVERASADRVRVYQRLLAAGNLRLEPPLHVTCYGDSFTLGKP